MLRSPCGSLLYGASDIVWRQNKAMNLAPLAGLVGATMASLSVIKWVLLGFLAVLALWVLSGARGSRNALEARAIRDLVKSAAQWNARAVQDSNPVIALMNANYAMAYFNTARSVGSDVDIEKHTGVAVDELLRDIESTQSRAVQRITAACPSVTPQGLAAVHTGWLAKTA